MRIDLANPKWEDRDRFILSKGHAAPVLWRDGGARRRKRRGKTEHAAPVRVVTETSHMRFIPSLEASTGSRPGPLARPRHGAGRAAGGHRAYVMLGDGEFRAGLGSGHAAFPERITWQSWITAGPAGWLREGHHGCRPRRKVARSATRSKSTAVSPGRALAGPAEWASQPASWPIRSRGRLLHGEQSQVPRHGAPDSACWPYRS